MFDTDECYKKIERRFTNLTRTTGETENSFFQHVGRIYNMDIGNFGKMYETMLTNVEHIMTGQKPHGYQQNKKTELEKLQEKGRSENGEYT